MYTKPLSHRGLCTQVTWGIYRNPTLSHNVYQTTQSPRSLYKGYMGHIQKSYSLTQCTPNHSATEVSVQRLHGAYTETLLCHTMYTKPLSHRGLCTQVTWGIYRNPTLSHNVYQTTQSPRSLYTGNMGHIQKPYSLTQCTPNHSVTEVSVQRLHGAYTEILLSHTMYTKPLGHRGLCTKVTWGIYRNPTLSHNVHQTTQSPRSLYTGNMGHIQKPYSLTQCIPNHSVTEVSVHR